MGRGGFPRQQEKRREARGRKEEKRGERGEGGKMKERLEDQEKRGQYVEERGTGERNGYHDNKGRGML